jgi:hypothetical protein
VFAMELFTKLFGDLLLFVYHCFDRIVINGYLSGLSRPEQLPVGGGIDSFRANEPSVPGDGLNIQAMAPYYLTKLRQSVITISCSQSIGDQHD